MMKHIVIALRNSILGAMLIGAVVFAGQYAFEKYSPTHYWVSYDQIITKDSYTTNETLKFKSISKFPRGGHTEWTDVLRCDLNGDGVFEFFSVYRSSYINPSQPEFPVTNPDNILEGGWFYQANTPRKDALCYVDSHTELRTPLGLIKTVMINTSTFEIIKEELRRD